MKRFQLGLFGLATAGLLFSGYLSAVKLFTDTCAFGETCPYFLGYPSCWYGFAMYLVMFIVTGISLIDANKIRTALRTDIFVSALGIIFAGSFTVGELLTARITGTLGLSTCAYGLLFYIAIFVISLRAMKRA